MSKTAGGLVPLPFLDDMFETCIKMGNIHLLSSFPTDVHHKEINQEPSTTRCHLDLLDVVLNLCMASVQCSYWQSPGDKYDISVSLPLL